MEFLKKCSLLMFFVIYFCNKNVNASHQVFRKLQSSSTNLVKNLFRTGYHFQPAAHWINGLMYYNGIYHLFYQYNPKGEVWGNIVWAHSISTDLVNWINLEPAIIPSELVILYTGIVDENQTQVQNYAIPADLSTHFFSPDKSINETKFRDPTTAWLGQDGHWRMVVGSLRKNRRGLAILYRSKDFMKWTKAQHPLHSSIGTGNWECVDFFPVSLEHTDGLDTSSNGNNIKHVLKVSLDDTRYDYYTIGTYDTKKDKYTPDDTMIDGWKGLRLDYGNFYASKTFYDPNKNRRILCGWVNESMLLQPIPLTKDGPEFILFLVNYGLILVDVEVTFSFSSLENVEEFEPSWADLYAQDVCAIRSSTVQGGLGPFGLLTLSSENLEEYTPVFFECLRPKINTRSSVRNHKKMYKPSFAGYVDVDLTNKTLSLRSLIDHSVVESFGAGGKTCITSRVYPALAIYNDTHLFAFNNGTETIKIETLDAWSMDKCER
ncbi:unnamed protein product [Withania somnifera]